MRLLFVLIFYFYLVSPAWAIVYYVAPASGSSNTTNACSSIDAPTEAGPEPTLFRSTIASASACATSGDTILVKAGVYPGNDFVTNVSGVIYKSQTLHGAILRPTGGDVLWGQNGSSVTIDGFDIDGSANSGTMRMGIFNDNTNFTLRNNKIHDITTSAGTSNLANFGGSCVSNNVGAVNFTATNNDCYNIGLGSSLGPGTHGIYSAQPSGGAIENNRIHHIRSSGASLYNNNVGGTGTRVSGNTIHHVETGLYILDGNGHQVYNNLVYNNSQTDVFIQKNNSFYYNNTILGALVISEFSSNNTIRNNIILGGISNPFGTSVTANTNITTGSPTLHFADAANGDFRLCSEPGVPSATCATASSAVGAGVDLTTPCPGCTTDIVGSLRVVPWDIGAYKAVSVGPPPPTPALVLQISCDNVVTDSSGVTPPNNGTLTGGATYNPSGKYGAACSFDGVDDHILVADSASLDLSHAFTLEAQVKLSAPMTTDQIVIQKAGGVDGSYYLQASSTGICGAGAPMGGYEQGPNVTACYATPLNTNWNHLAVTYDSQGTPNVRFYINHVEVTNAVGSAILSANTGALYIGGIGAGGGIPFLVDEIRVYNYARTPAQIADDDATPINPPVAPAALAMGAGPTTMKWGASANIFKIAGSTTAPPVIAQVAFDAASEFPTGTVGNTNAASFSWTHTPVGTPAGVLVFTFAISAANTATAVSYGGDALTAVTGGLAADTATEPGSCRAWFVGTSVPTGPQTVLVTRTNNAVAMYAVAITLTAGANLAVIGTPVLQQENAALVQSSIDTGAIIAQRFACAYYGGSNVPAIAAATSTRLQELDFGLFTANVDRETTPGSGNRPAGSTAGSEDRAAVTLAIGIP